MLLVSGRLDLAPSESPVSDLGTLVTQNRADDKGYQAKQTPRRTLYTPIIRNNDEPAGVPVQSAGREQSAVGAE